jgi:hypothetical protein
MIKKENGGKEDERYFLFRHFLFFYYLDKYFSALRIVAYAIG